MSDDVKLETIKETQDILGKFIKKPILTEKLLKKPPFRFLYDICTVAMKETGFFSSVLNKPEDMIENIKDRNGKIAFLNKVIAAVESANGIKLSVKPSKVVAGLEATKTNEFLQALGKALAKQQGKNKNDQIKDQVSKTKSNRKDSKDERADKKYSNNKAVKPNVENKVEDNLNNASKKKSLENHHEISPREKQTSKSKSHETTSKKVEKVTEEKNSLDKKHKEKSIDVGGSPQISSDKKTESNKKKDQSIAKKEPEKNEAVSSLKIEATNSDKKDNDFEVQKKVSLIEELSEKQKHRRRSIPDSAECKNEAEVKVENKENNEKENKTQLETKEMKFENAPNKDKTLEERNKINTMTPIENFLTEKKATPNPSPPPPPPLTQQNYPKRENTVTSRPRTGIRQMTARPASARPAAPRIREKNDIAVEEEPEKLGIGKNSVVNVIVDKDIENEPDEDTLIFLENTHDELLEDISNSALPAMASLAQEEKHGHLVEQILEAQKELENENALPSSEDKITGSTETEWDNSHNSKTAVWEIEKLRNNIQTLTRSVNPLGNLLNFFQEDVDSIQKELETWKNKNSSLCIQIANEKSITEQFIEPLKIHLKEIQQSINEQYEQISIVKANIIRNNKKIQKLLASG